MKLFCMWGKARMRRVLPGSLYQPVALCVSCAARQGVHISTKPMRSVRWIPEPAGIRSVLMMFGHAATLGLAGPVLSASDEKGMVFPKMGMVAD